MQNILPIVFFLKSLINDGLVARLAVQSMVSVLFLDKTSELYVASEVRLTYLTHLHCYQ